MTVENIGSAWHFPPVVETSFHKLVTSSYNLKKEKKRNIYKTEPKPPQNKSIEHAC